jgi:hypothetical protein
VSQFCPYSLLGITASFPTRGREAQAPVFWSFWSYPSFWVPRPPPLGFLAELSPPLVPLFMTRPGAGRDKKMRGRRDHAGASLSPRVGGSRNLHGRKRRLKITRKGRVRREELGNGGGGWRASQSRETVMHPSQLRLARAHTWARTHTTPG